MNRKQLSSIFPFLIWSREVNKMTVRADLIAGLTGAVIVLPQGVAFALIAGMPPIYGLYTAMVLPVIAGLFGSSRHLISGPTTAISIVVFAAVSGYADPGSPEFVKLALLVTFLAGVFQLVFGLVRLGALVNFVSHTVVLGFTAGAALLIFTSQLGNFFGLERPKGASFAEGWQFLAMHLNDINLWAFLIGGVTLVTALIIKAINKRLPHLLIAMIAGSLVSYMVGAEEHGIKLVGSLPSGFPPFSGLNYVQGTVNKVLPDAFAIALLGLIEAVAIARSIATKSGQFLNPSQEFIGQGLSNIIGSFFSSYAGSGSFTRSGVNYDAGARTPLAAIFAALFLLLIILFVGPLAAYLPLPAMGGIILLVAYNLVDLKHIKTVLRSSKRETTVMSITFLATLTMDLEYAIYLGVIFSLVFYLQRTSTPRIVPLAPDPEDKNRRFHNVKLFDLVECPQLKVVRVEGSLFFGAVQHVESEFREFRTGAETHLLLVGNGINLIDTSGSEFLVNEAAYWRSRGGAMYISGLKLRARHSLERGGFDKKIGAENFFLNKETAIQEIYDRLDSNTCANCKVKIFTECNKNVE